MISNTETNSNQGNPSKDILMARDECELLLGSILSSLRDYLLDNFKVINMLIDNLTKQILKTDQQGETLKGYFDAMKESGHMLKKKALVIFFE